MNNKTEFNKKEAAEFIWVSKVWFWKLVEAWKIKFTSIPSIKRDKRVYLKEDLIQHKRK